MVICFRMVWLPYTLLVITITKMWLFYFWKMVLPLTQQQKMVILLFTLLLKRIKYFRIFIYNYNYSFIVSSINCYYFIQMDIATTLLEYGAKANAESKAGFTPLHLAAQEGHSDMATLLIQHQADVNHHSKVCLMFVLFKVWLLKLPKHLILSKVKMEGWFYHIQLF